jgi:uncharacterized damage-inducible protein DinB
MTDTDLSKAGTTETDRLADQLERSFRGGAWHGPSVTEALADLTAEEAARRPIPAAHTIAEIVGHLATWTDVAHRRIAGEPVPRVTDDEDFPPGGAASEEAWNGSLERLEEAHRKLHEVVAGLDADGLDAPVSGSDPTVRGLVLGVLQHNTYHAGQIALLRKAEVVVAIEQENVA